MGGGGPALGRVNGKGGTVMEKRQLELMKDLSNEII